MTPPAEVPSSPPPAGTDPAVPGLAPDWPAAAPPRPGTLRRLLRRGVRRNPLRVLAFGYGSYILLTWLALCLPVCWKGPPVAALDNLFVSTSAVSTTGLVTVNTPEAYSVWGQLVILIAFQLGGLGYMTLGSFIVLSRRHALSDVRTRMGSAAFSLPEGFELATFVRHVVVFTLLIEAAGALALAHLFGGAGVADPWWPAVFHSVSAFCTAGFSVFPDSLEAFRGDFWINATIAALSFAGAVGFLVFSDLWLTLTGRRQRVTLTSRIILYVTLWTIMLGTVALFLLEDSLRGLPLSERLLGAAFQALSALTTVGFDTHAPAAFGGASVVVLIVLMIMGASPSGTGGGLKSTSVSAALASVLSVLRRSDRITFWGTEVPEHRLRTAWASLVFYALAFVAGTVLLLAVESHLAFEDLVFEAASALGTVGLSRGTTPQLGEVGKLLVMVLMFVGRLGPLTFGLAFFSLRERNGESSRTEDLAV